MVAEPGFARHATSIVPSIGNLQVKVLRSFTGFGLVLYRGRNTPGWCCDHERLCFSDGVSWWLCGDVFRILVRPGKDQHEAVSSASQ